MATATAAPATAPAANTAWNRGIIDRPSERSTSAPCTFITTSQVEPERPMMSSPVSSTPTPIRSRRRLLSIAAQGGQRPEPTAAEKRPSRRLRRAGPSPAWRDVDAGDRAVAGSGLANWRTADLGRRKRGSWLGWRRGGALIVAEARCVIAPMDPLRSRHCECSGELGDRVSTHPNIEDRVVQHVVARRRAPVAPGVWAQHELDLL